MESEARGASWCIAHKAQCGVAALHPMPTASAPTATMQPLLGEAQHPQNPARMGPAWGEARSDLRDAFAPLDPLLELLGGFCSRLSAAVLPCQSQGKPNSNSSEPVLIL